MFGRKVKLRVYSFIIIIVSIIAIIFFILKSLENNVVYFFSPTEIFSNESLSLNKKIRVGGLVKEGSIVNESTSIKFIITDLNNEIIVNYKGLVPNLFSEGKGVVVEGLLKDKKYFIAETIIAKHDENYMPPEVKDALEKSQK